MKWSEIVLCEADQPTELPMDNAARLGRARQLGFDTKRVYYHGTGKNFQRFSAKFHGSTMGTQNREAFAVWLSSDPEVAGVYAAYDPTEHAWWGSEEDRPKPGVRNPNLMPIFVRLRKPMIIDCTNRNHYQLLKDKSRAIRYAKEDGHDGIMFRNAEDGSAHRSDILGVFNPKNVRGIYARFDPAKQGTSDLLA